jgi:hypothetical protein
MLAVMFLLAPSFRNSAGLLRSFTSESFWAANEPFERSRELYLRLFLADSRTPITVIP